MGLCLPTHGLGRRDEEMRPAKIAQWAERFGSHSVWCSDHILVTRKPGRPRMHSAVQGPSPCRTSACK